MSGYFIIRLGADSEAEIREIDAIDSYFSDPFSIEVHCKQIPKAVAPGDIAIVWLGTNNNKGGKTPWVQGVRAIGCVAGVYGEGGYGSAKAIKLGIGVVLPRTVTKMDIVTKQSVYYPDIAAMPVLGVNNYSSQVVQRIEPGEPGQSLSALFLALEGLVPGFDSAINRAYPNLRDAIDKLYLNEVLVPNSSKEIESVMQVKPSERSDLDNGIQFDDDGLDPDEVRDSEIDVPFDPSKIDIIAKAMTISSLEGRLDNDELDLTPDFQRNANVWDLRRKARLIESILLRIPLPSFYFSEDSDGGYAVVDGLQRLCAVFHFKNPMLLNLTTGAKLPPLRLKGLQYLKELEGCTFSELDRKFQRRISELEITANIIRASTPSAVKFNVFARLNQGGLPLTAQEIRNAIFPGEWRNELRRLAESKSFLIATDGKVRVERQQDMELVLRYIALWQLGAPYHRPSGQTLDEFLNFTVEHVLLRWNSEKWEEAAQAFFYAIEAACIVRGKHAFRKSAGQQQRKPINRGLFEAELIVFGSLDRLLLSNFNFSKYNARTEELILDALVDNKEFVQSLLSGTGSAESSNARISTLNGIVDKVIYA